jgi:hypothetical protein
MPVQKFRTFDEAERALWVDCNDPTLPQRIRAHWSRWRDPAAVPFPRGVHKYRSQAEADADQERWEDQRIARIRDERLRK